MLACAVAPLPPLVRYRIISQWSFLAIGGLRLLCGVRYRVSGIHHIPPCPLVFLSRHESAWETIAYQLFLPPLAFVLKKNLLHIPFFGWGLRRMSQIAIDRVAGSSAMRQLLRQGRARLAAGFCVVVFPEGTRLPPGQRRRYFSGGAALAKAAGVSVVPIALDSGKCWGRNHFFKRRGIIHVRIGQPIATEHLSVADINEQARIWIESASQ